MTNTTRTVRIPEEYRPISMWGYFGYELLFAIPVIGWILIVVFALTASNHNLRNFARSQFCLLIIWLILISVSVISGTFITVVQSLIH